MPNVLTTPQEVEEVLHRTHTASLRSVLPGLALFLGTLAMPIGMFFFMASMSAITSAADYAFIGVGYVGMMWAFSLFLLAGGSWLVARNRKV